MTKIQLRTPHMSLIPSVVERFASHVGFYTFAILPCFLFIIIITDDIILPVRHWKGYTEGVSL